MSQQAAPPTRRERWQYHHHPWIHERKKQPPVRVADQLPLPTGGSLKDKIERFNTRLALRVTNSVGSMGGAYLFAVIALVSLPAAIASRNVIVIISWVAQTFLQLVLLSVILVASNAAAKAADKQALATYNDGEASLHEILSAQDHLLAQDELIKETQKVILAAVSDARSGESGERLARRLTPPRGTPPASPKGSASP